MSRPKISLKTKMKPSTDSASSAPASTIHAAHPASGGRGMSSAGAATRKPAASPGIATHLARRIITVAEALRMGGTPAFA
jgi:hypothetical protein